MEPLVSVKMITYNHAPYIAQAIEGVLMQKTSFPFELVIGEDCSTDGTREIVVDYKTRFPHIIRVVTSERNVGMMKNGLRTLAECKGKYIAFCEGDDYWHRQDKLQMQVDYMEKHPRCGLIHSDYNRYIVREDRLIQDFNKTVNNSVRDDLDMIEILRGGKYLLILTCTVMVRKRLVDKIAFVDKELYESDRFLLYDTSLWAEIAHVTRTHYINESLATYTVAPESASKSVDPIKQLEFGQSVSEMCLYLARKYRLPESEKRYHLRRLADSALPLAFYTNNKELAKKVHRMMSKMSVKNKIFYCGAMNCFVNRGVRWFLSARNRVRCFVGFRSKSPSLGVGSELKE